MKKIFIICVLMIIAYTSFSQQIDLATGKYYKSGMLYTGEHQEYYETGQLLTQLHIVNGDIDGIQKIFFQDGAQKEQRSYKEGLKDGTWVTWNAAGVKVAVANYQSNVKHGEWIIRDDNNTLRYEMFYKKGRKTGTWIMYNENGQETGRKSY